MLSVAECIPKPLSTPSCPPTVFGVVCSLLNSSPGNPCSVLQGSYSTPGTATAAAVTDTSNPSQLSTAWTEIPDPQGLAGHLEGAMLYYLCDTEPVWLPQDWNLTWNPCNTLGIGTCLFASCASFQGKSKSCSLPAVTQTCSAPSPCINYLPLPLSHGEFSLLPCTLVFHIWKPPMWLGGMMWMQFSCHGTKQEDESKPLSEGCQPWADIAVWDWRDSGAGHESTGACQRARRKSKMHLRSTQACFHIWSSWPCH